MTFADLIPALAETVSSRIFLFAIGLSTTILVARALGPEGRGLFSVAGTVGAIGVQLGNLGLHASNTYAIARDRRLLPVLLGNSLLAGLGGGAVISLATGLFFLAAPGVAPVRGVLAVLALAWIPLGLAYQLGQNLLLGLEEIRLYNVIDVVGKSLVLGLMGVMLVKRVTSPSAFFGASLAVLVATFLWAFIALARKAETQATLSQEIFREMLTYGLKAYLAALFSFIVLRIDLLMVNSFLGAAQAGQYSIAVAMADMLFMLPVVVGTVLFPRMSAIPDGDQRLALAKSTAKVIAGVMLILAGVAAALTGPAVRIFFGKAFAPAIPAFLVLLPGLWFMSINVVYQNYFAACGMPPVAVYSPAVAAVLNVLANFWLIPKLGIVGASWSSTACYSLMLALSTLYLRKGGGPQGGRERVVARSAG